MNSGEITDSDLNAFQTTTKFAFFALIFGCLQILLLDSQHTVDTAGCLAISFCFFVNAIMPLVTARYVLPLVLDWKLVHNYLGLVLSTYQVVQHIFPMTISLGILAYHYQVTVPALEPRIKVYAMHFLCRATVFSLEGSTMIDKIGLSVGVYSPVGVFLIGVTMSEGVLWIARPQGSEPVGVGGMISYLLLSAYWLVSFWRAYNRAVQLDWKSRIEFLRQSKWQKNKSDLQGKIDEIELERAGLKNERLQLMRTLKAQKEHTELSFQRFLIDFTEIKFQDKAKALGRGANSVVLRAEVFGASVAVKRISVSDLDEMEDVAREL